MTRAIATVALLVCANSFMTLAWYGQIAFRSKFERVGLIGVIFLSWSIALFEYFFMVPANRLGSAQFGGPFSLWELKVMQEVITLIIFTLFMLAFMKSEPIRWNHLVGFFFLVVAVFFIFKK